MPTVLSRMDSFAQGSRNQELTVGPSMAGEAASFDVSAGHTIDSPCYTTHLPLAGLLNRLSHHTDVLCFDPRGVACFEATEH